MNPSIRLAMPASAKALLARRLPFLKKPASKDALFLSIEKGINLGIGFFVSIIVIRHLGPEQYGLFSYVMAWTMVLSPLATLGLADPLVKSLVQEPHDTTKVVSTVFLLRIAAAIFAALCLVGLFASGLLVSSGNDPSFITRVAAISALQYLAQSFDIFESYNQANGRISMSTRSRIIALLIVSPLRLLAAEMDCDVATFTWLVVLQLLVSFSITYVGVVPSKIRPRLEFDPVVARRLMGLGIFIVVAGLLNMLQARSEMFFLERLAGLQAVGMYSVSLRFVELFDLFGTIAVTIYLPKLLASSKEELESDKALVVTYRLALALYAACLPLILMMAGFAYFALSAKFPGIHWLIIAMATRPLATFLGLTRSMYMLAANSLRYSVLCSLSGLLISIAAAMILIPMIGLYGAAASAFLSYSFSNLWIDALFNRRYFRAFIKAVTFR